MASKSRKLFSVRRLGSEIYPSGAPTRSDGESKGVWSAAYKHALVCPERQIRSVPPRGKRDCSSATSSDPGARAPEVRRGMSANCGLRLLLFCYR